MTYEEDKIKNHLLKMIDENFNLVFDEKTKALKIQIEYDNETYVVNIHRGLFNPVGWF